VTGFDQLAADFAKAAFGVQSAMRDVFHDTADETKKGWQDNIRAVAPKHLPHAPKSITFETRLTGSSVRAEVGPEAGRSRRTSSSVTNSAHATRPRTSPAREPRSLPGRTSSVAPTP
jgi:hypothetical protein